MRRFDLAFSVAVVVLGLLVLFLSRDFPGGFRGSGLGPGFIPKVLVVLLLVLTAPLLIGVIRGKSDQPDGFTWDSLRLPLTLTIMIIAYSVFINYLGFLIDTAGLLFVAMVILKIPFKRALFLSVILTALIYSVFRLVLHVPLPEGTLLGV